MTKVNIFEKFAKKKASIFCFFSQLPKSGRVGEFQRTKNMDMIEKLNKHENCPDTMVTSIGCFQANEVAMKTKNHVLKQIANQVCESKKNNLDSQVGHLNYASNPFTKHAK